MKRYILKRVLNSIFILWLVMTVVFFGLRFIPGGPVQQMLGIQATQESIESLRQQLGLNRPLYVQYLDYLTDVLTLDLGRSITWKQEITTLIMQAAPKTLSIAFVGIVIGLLISIPAGIISALRKQEPIDYVATITAFFGISMPAFFTGILLSLIFGVWFGILPVFGYTPLSEGVFSWLRSIILPGIAVGLPYGAVVMRMMRSSLLEVMDQEYMRTAKAKGVSERTALIKHAMQNALIPVVTVAGIQLAIIIVGSVTVEIVFAIQGLGRLLVQSILNRDYPVTQAIIILVATVMLSINLAVDLLYTVLDPRIGYGGDNP